jgi:hypothetical protein
MRLWLPVLLVLSMVGTAQAGPGDQDQSSSAQSAPPARPTPDFLFGRPDGSVGFRGSWVFGRAGSDWYDFVTDQLTLESSDFNTGAFGTDLNITVAPRLDVVIGLDYSQSTSNSEYRRFVDNNRLPIAQQTRLRTANIGAGLKFALTERGREVGRLAWVPRKVVPYVGAGGGALWFQVRQSGDFVDFVDLSVFPDVFDTKGWTPSAQLFGGIDVKIHRRAYLTFDGRYLWAAGDLGSDWIDFDPIDLSGARMSVGINLVFSEGR